jgi:hypothetical protein
VPANSAQASTRLGLAPPRITAWAMRGGKPAAPAAERPAARHCHVRRRDGRRQIGKPRAADCHFASALLSGRPVLGTVSGPQSAANRWAAATTMAWRSALSKNLQELRWVLGYQIGQEEAFLVATGAVPHALRAASSPGLQDPLVSDIQRQRRSQVRQTSFVVVCSVGSTSFTP